MQNRFRFRMYNNKTKVMIYDVETINDRFVSFSDNKDIILMQCTGLKDKNGKLIYEGDVVKCDRDYDKDGRVNLIRVIEWYCQAFCVAVPNIEIYPLSFVHNIEVIGDIYTNPELVEKANANNSKI